MRGVSIFSVSRVVLTLIVSCFFIQGNAQNDQIALRAIGKKEFSVKSLNGIPYTVVIESSNNDGQFHLGSTGRLTFKIDDMIDTRSTLRIVFEEEIYHSLEDKLLEQYKADIKWIQSELEIKESELKMFPTRPVFTDAGLEKLKGKVFEYVTNDRKESYFNKWIEKINYSVGAVGFFRELYGASNGEDNSQRHNFLPINIHEELNN
ncbi:hypothetical protein [Aquimarina sp. I32.4]|uniref:hypothetical protein n=1 Tax=Aquimarina sp. I32.4 TaxID=2053903 RepID=UPI000CDEF777|nr:hypothetical protein [Aquimarina sp. I32.4]